MSALRSKHAQTLVALLCLPLLFASLFIPPQSLGAPLVPPGSTIYIFAGNDDGLRQPFISNGNGTFTAGASFLYGDNNRGGAIADYDEDGDLDFVGCNDDISECHLFLQTAPGIFTQFSSVAGGAFPLAGTESGMAADDFNQDGHADVLMGGNQSVAAIFFGNGTGSFPTSINNLLPTATTAPYFAKDTGDLDGNGYPDVVLGAAGGGNVYSYLNTAGVFSGPFTLFDATPTPAPPNTVTVADFDGDGLLDIVAGGENSGEISFWKGNGTGNSPGSFTLVSQIFDFNTQASADSYDFDGDQDQDLVVLARVSGSIFFLSGNGDGTFQAPVLISTIPGSGFGMEAPPVPPIRSIVSGKIFHDLNTDGTDNDGPGGVGNVQLTLTGTDYRGLAVNFSTTSALDGSYTIKGVPLDNGNNFTLSATPPSPPPTLYSPTTTTSLSVSIPMENTHVTEKFGYLLCTDADGDGFATEGGACGPVDCNDTNAAVNPGATEQCNGIDDDCNGTVDEGFDVDGDGYYTGGGICGAVDCNDADAAVNPGATEQCDNIDNDCDGTMDEGLDQDGDGFSACAGDCNDVGPTSGEATLTITLLNVSSSGPGADMSATIYVGNGASPAGATTVTIPLTQNGTAIADPSSSPDVPGFHVQRGIDAGTPFVRLTAYGHNSSSTREHVEGTLSLTNATVENSHGGPMGSYERPHDGSCTGQPGNDEFSVLNGGTTGSFCSTTNTNSDTLTIFYALSAGIRCQEITNPGVQCSDPAFALCGVCIHPGAEDPFGDGIDNDCDAAPECSKKTDYEERNCNGKLTVKNDAELDAYLLDFGLKNGKYRDLEIKYNVNRSFVDIHSPCKISIAPKKTVTGNLICIDGRAGVRAKSQTTITGQKIALLSEKGNVWLKAKGKIFASSQLLLSAFKKAILGSHTSVTGGGSVRLLGIGSRSVVALDSHAVIDASSVFMAAVERARLGNKTVVESAGNFHMDAAQCRVHQSATIDAGSTSGRCLAPTMSLSNDNADEEDEDGED